MSINTVKSANDIKIKTQMGRRNSLTRNLHLTEALIMNDICEAVELFLLKFVQYGLIVVLIGGLVDAVL